MEKYAGVGAVLLTTALALTACTGAPALEVTTSTPESSAAPTATETSPAPAELEAERGTRSNPLAVGEARKIAEKSMWTVSAIGSTEVREGYLILPLRLQMDWDASRANTAEGGGDPASVDNEGVDPVSAIFVSFVAASGRSYDAFEQYEADVPSPQIWELGTLFPPAQSVDAFHVVSVPAEEVAGGVWQVQNYAGESVYLAP